MIIPPGRYAYTLTYTTSDGVHHTRSDEIVTTEYQPEGRILAAALGCEGLTEANIKDWTWSLNDAPEVTQ